MGYTIPKIENGPLVRNGNTTNSNGMYGRVREDALERIFNIMKLKPTDVFIDLGHGIGLVSIQAAYTRACESRGIEKDKDRNKFASDLKDTFVKRLKHSKENNVTYNDVSKESGINWFLILPKQFAYLVGSGIFGWASHI